MRRTQEEKEKIGAAIGSTIYMKLKVDSIKREPKQPNQKAGLAERLEFFEKVRDVAKEQIEDGDYSNAK